jgi:hypothetical protein
MRKGFGWGGPPIEFLQIWEYVTLGEIRTEDLIDLLGLE